MRQHELPPSNIFRYNLINAGATGVVLRITPSIALKYALRGKLAEFTTANAYHDLVARPAPATIVQSFLRLPGLNFLPLLPGSLADRLRANQDREAFPSNRLLSVRRLEPVPKIGQWAAELAGAILWLKKDMGLVHGDVRPDNILLDHEDHLKLTDFDSTAPFGSKHPGGCTPWNQIHACFGRCPERCPGSYARYGVLTEQLAVGSIVYNLITGVELYEGMGPEALDLFNRFEFPALGETPLERLTVNCWMGRFATLEDLARETAALEGARGAEKGRRLDDVYMEKMRKECEELVEGELAEFVPHADVICVETAAEEEVAGEESV
ncbi:hypothetical protein PWT90_06484 [Aphanocladium album]|nr:hypothetical protein PWT90_06484 [Aphanocladium album]